MEKIQLYPSNIFKGNIPEVTQHYIDTSVKMTYDMMQQDAEKDNGKNSCSVRNGWQSHKELYNIPHFAKLADVFLYKVKTEINKKNLPFYMTSMWLNVHGKNGFNHIHVHSGSWYSGVFYLQVGNNSGNIAFTDPRPAAEMSYHHFLTDYQVHSFKPEVGTLIMFPSWLPHFVEPNCDELDRISVSFNIELDV